MWRFVRGIYNWFLYPWRITDIMEWTEREAKKFVDRVNKYKQKPFTIAVVGLAGQGKSSFINSVFSAIRGRLVFPANSLIATGTPTTKKVEPYFLDDHKQACILDCQGYREEKDANDDFNLEVMKTILSTGKWHENDELQEKTEYAVDAVILCAEYLKKFKELKNKQLTNEIVRLLADCNIPVFLMITHIDCAEEKCDFIVRDVFKDFKLEKAVREASDLLKLDENKILLQCNHNTKNQKTDLEKSILTLFNLGYILETVFSRKGFP